VLLFAIVLQCNLSIFATDTTSQLDVLRHDGDTLGVDRVQVGILKQTDQLGHARFLQGHNCRALESQIGLKVKRETVLFSLSFVSL